MSIKAPRKPSTKGTPPQLDAAQLASSKTPADRAAGGDAVIMNFSVPNEFRREFKTVAVTLDMSMVGVLREAFELFKREKGIS